MLEPTTVRLRTADGVALAARYWPSPDRRLACVVAHGFTGTSQARPVVTICRRLAGAGFGVLAPDFRGHGRSGGWSTVGQAEVHDVAAAVARLRVDGYQAVAVLGWSMGGSIVLRYAGLGGDADAVLSVSAPAHWYERGTRPMRVVHWICETPSGRLAARLARRTRLAAEGWAELPESPVELVGQIAPRPLLIVHGATDRYFPVRHAELLARAAPDATVWIEPGMGHAEAATAPELLDRMIAWLRQCPGLAVPP